MKQTGALTRGVQLPDPYWEAAAAAAVRALDEADHVLVPAEFLPLHERFSPLEYSWAVPADCRLAWCLSKDDVHRLAPSFHEFARALHYCSWSNEVFVLGGNFRWQHGADRDSRRHLEAWYQRVAAYMAGQPSRPFTGRQPAGFRDDELPLDGPEVLVVGASAMGNAGDDLLGDVLAEMLLDLGCRPTISGPDVDPQSLAAFDAIVVGGGGLIYASRGGENDTQNLGNYLRFGPVARHLGIPAAMIGVGDQDHAGGMERDSLTRQFVGAALPMFSAVTTRDGDSASLLRRHGARSAVEGSDLLFAWTDRARAAVHPSALKPSRLALAGEFFRFSAFCDGFGSQSPALADVVQDQELDLLIMSDDDVPHADRLRDLLGRCGASPSIVDVRGYEFEALVFLFASCRGVITTRFHGLVLAAISDVPVMAVDVPGGKLDRLMQAFGMPEAVLTDACEAPVEMLRNGLNGNLADIPREALDQQARAVDVHRQALHDLVKVLPGFRGTDDSESTRSVRRLTDGRYQTTTGNRCSSERTGSDGPIGLCWAASTRETNGYANLGDALSAVVVAALSGRPVQHVDFGNNSTKLVAVGSIGHAIQNGLAVVWGTGVSIRGGLLARNVPRTRYDVRAVRGQISARHFRDFGIEVPDVYGDPVWFLPSILDEPVEPVYELGVIPHIRDIDHHHPDAPPRPDSLRCVVPDDDAGAIRIINTWHEPTWEAMREKIRLIRSCRRIVSQSFHGVVIAEAYGIPVLNFRNLPQQKNGMLDIDLREDCGTDPRVWEFYKAGRNDHFVMYNQRRDEHTDWADVMNAIDRYWQPFEFDAAPLAEAFPVPLAYDPLYERALDTSHLSELRF
jgi:pyruvyltransferase